MMEIQKQVHYWKESAKSDWKTSQGLFQLGRYDACLFFCHLTLEKLLKGLVVRKTRKIAPFIHDLVELAHFANLNLSEDLASNLRLITTFNIAGRYADTKLQLHKKATKTYAKKYLDITNKIRLWLQKEYRKK